MKIKWAVLFFVLFSCFIFSFSKNQITPSVKDIPVLSSKIDSVDLRADQIFVIDRSGSMKSYWTDVVSAIVNLVSILPDGDYVSVLGFDSYCSKLVTPRTLNKESRKLLIEEFEKLNPPSGQKTDLYEAIDKTLDELTRENSNSIKFVYFITDLKNEPPANSQFKSPSSINNLKSRIKEVVSNLDVKLIFYALQVPLSANAGKDYQNISKLFQEKIERVFLDKNSLARWFQNQAKELVFRKYKAIVLSQLGSGLKILDFGANSNEIDVTIQNPYSFDIKILSINLFSEKYGRLSASFDTIIKTEEDDEFTFNAFKAFYNEKSFLENKNIKYVDLEVEYLLLPKNEFDKLSVAPLQTNIYKGEKLFFASGIPVYIILIIIVIIIIGLYFLLLPCLKPLKTFNNKNFNVSVKLDGQPINLKRKSFPPSAKEIIIDNNAILKTPYSVGMPYFKIVIKPVKPSFPFCRSPKRGTYILNKGNLSFTSVVFKEGKKSEMPLNSDVTSGEPLNLLGPLSLKATEISDQGTIRSLEIILSLQ